MSDQTRDARRFGCPSCGGQLRWDIQTNQFICGQCATGYQPDQLPSDTGEKREDDIPVVGYHCPQCGAEIVSSEMEATSFCSYCGSDVVLEQRLTRMQRPDGIVPFIVDRKRCEQLYRSHLRRHIFAPGGLLRRSVIDHFRPIYIPFWSFHVTSSGPFKLRGSDTVKTTDETITSRYAMELDISIDQKQMLYDASRAFEDETAARLEPRINNEVRFHPAYLSGFYAQAPDAAPETYRDEAITNAYHRFIQSVITDYHLHEISTAVDTDKIDLPNVQVTQRLVMFPVWLLAHRQGDRMLYTAINGANGKVVCDVPVSPVRVSIVTLLIAAALFALLYRLPTMKPDWMMLPCTAFALRTQYRLLGTARILTARENREGDPFLSAPGTYSGLAERYLQEDLNRYLPKEEQRMKNDIHAVWKDIRSFLTRARKFLIVVSAILILILLNSKISTSAFRDFSIAAMTAGVIFALWICFDRGRRIPFGRYRRFAMIINIGMLAVNIMSIVLLLLNPAEDLVYYACCILLLLINIAAMVYLWSQHNRYTTRPVPFFGEETAP